MTAPNVSGFDESRWPVEAGFIDQSTVTPLQFRIARRALRDVGLCEIPKGSNRSTRIDRYLREAGVPESVIRSGEGFWCAAWAGAVWRDAGAKVPLAYAACQNWLNWGLKNGTLKPTPTVGSVVLYMSGGNKSKSHHCGIVLRVDNGYTVSIEGNTTLNGYSNNGLFCGLKEVALDKVIGYVHPLEATP
jgi:hypothetical protein